MSKNETRAGLVVAHRVIQMLDRISDANDEDKQVAIEIVREILTHGSCMTMPIEAESSG